MSRQDKQTTKKSGEDLNDLVRFFAVLSKINKRRQKNERI